MLIHDQNKCYTLMIKSNILEQCQSLKKNDDYCGRHTLNKTNKRIRIDDYQLIIDKNLKIPQIITFDDYMYNKTLNKIEIINIYYTLKSIYKQKNFNFVKPNDLKTKLVSYYDGFIKARKYLYIYRKIQIKYRQQKKLKKILLYGPCYFNKTLLNNLEDFYTLDNITDIPKEFYFSFLDKNGLYYGFDIRSLKILLSQPSNVNIYNKKNTIINPYSTNELIDDVISRINNLIIHLEKNGYILDIKTELTPEQKKRDSVMKIFNIIDQLGYQTNIDWLLCMNIKELKKFYQLLEDIWNYRCDLSEQSKKEIIPNENIDPLFKLDVEHVFNLRKYDDVMNINLKIIERLVSDSSNIGCRSLGALYVLTGLASISYQARNTYPDLVQSLN